MYNLLIAEAAEEDYTASLQWYAKRSRLAAERFEAEFAQALQLISLHAERYPFCDAQHRSFLLTRFPFQIIYRQLSEKDCLVVAVAHTSRSPDFWLNR